MSQIIFGVFWEEKDKENMQVQGFQTVALKHSMGVHALYLTGVKHRDSWVHILFMYNV